MKKFLSVVSALLCMSMLFSVGSVCAISEQNSLETICENYAIVFANGMDEEENAEYSIKETIRVVDVNGVDEGYHITLKNDNKDAGYVMVNPNSTNGFVSDYSFEGNGLYQSILEKGNSNLKMRSANSAQPIKPSSKIMVKTNDFEYAVKANDKSYITEKGQTVNKQDIMAKSNEYMSKKSMAISTKGSCGSYIVDECEIGVQSGERYAITGYNSFTIYDQYDITDTGRMYGCGPMAATNLMLYFRFGRNKTNMLLDSNLYKTYDKLIDTMGSYEKDGIYWTNDSSANTGIKKYISQRKYSVSSAVVGNWQECKTQLNANRPIFWCYSGGNIGHAIAVFGYVANTTGSRFLRVADGWNSFYRYYNITGNHGNGYAFNVA